MIEKLESIVSRFDELEELLSDPDVVSDQKGFIRLSKEIGNIRTVVEEYRKYK